jgi:hypothetical protein
VVSEQTCPFFSGVRPATADIEAMHPVFCDPGNGDRARDVCSGGLNCSNPTA